MGVGKSPATGMLVVLLVQLCMVDAWGAEVCRFTGASDYDGHVAVTTDVTAADGVTKVDVAGTFEATTMFWFHIRYLIEEVSTWRNGELETVAVNSRYLVRDHIVRQQWDYFDRGADGLQAQRVQGKTFVDFRKDAPRPCSALGPSDIWPGVASRLSPGIAGAPGRSRSQGLAATVGAALPSCHGLLLGQIAAARRSGCAGFLPGFNPIGFCI